MTNNSREI